MPENWPIGWGELVQILAFFGGLAVVVRLYYAGKLRMRRLEQAERLRALELGQPFPDTEIAWAQAETSRAAAIASVGLGVPLILAGAATAATMVILNEAEPRLHLPVLCTIWGSIALPSLVAVSMSLGILARRSRPQPTRKVDLHRAGSPAEQYVPR